MSDTLTEREKQLLRREGALAVLTVRYDGSLSALLDRVLPLPKTTTPRVLCDPIARYEWRVSNGALQERYADGDDGRKGEWFPGNGWTPEAHRVKMWADLLARPTEEVDDV